MPKPQTPDSISQATLSALAGVSTATLTMQLLKRGLRSAFMAGVKPLVGSGRIVGLAETWRFVPMREDISTVKSLGLPGNSRDAIEAAPEGCIIVADAFGCTRSGIIGDILAARMVQRGIKAMVTDGAVRDEIGVLATGLPVFAAGAAAPPSIAAVHFADHGQVIGCGGVMVRPGDVIVGDSDGVVVIPAEMAGSVAEDSVAQEDFEAYVLAEVRAGKPLTGLYPPSAETTTAYEEEQKG